MKKWKSLLLRSFREGSTQVWRNKFLSGTTVLLGALILFLLNFVFAIEFYADYSLKNLESRADFSVKLRENFDAFQFDALKNELGEFTLELEVLDEKIQEGISIPPRLNIKFNNLREVGDVFKVLKKIRYGEVVGDWDLIGERDFVQIIDKLLQVRDGVEKVGFWMSIIFFIGGFLIIINAFRIVIFSRKDEVFIARLSGADLKFISWPFLIEGALLGIIASVVAIILFVIVLREINFLPGGAIFYHFWNNVFSVEILISAIVGMLGAWIAVKKYLRGKFSF